MKHKYDSVSVVLFLAVLVIITTSNITSAAPRKLAAAKQDVNTNNLSSSSSSNDHSLPKMQTLDSFYKLMGLEEYCQNGDEECFKRRAIAEAHLDYIYTQHHKP